MVNNFGPLHIRDRDIGLIGLASVLAQCLLSTTVAAVMDRLKVAQLADNTIFNYILPPCSTG